MRPSTNVSSKIVSKKNANILPFLNAFLIQVCEAEAAKASFSIKYSNPNVGSPSEMAGILILAILGACNSSKLKFRISFAENTILTIAGNCLGYEHCNLAHPAQCRN